MKIDLTKILENKAAKVTLLITLITGIDLLIPWVQDLVIGDQIEDNNTEVYEYIDRQNEIQDSTNFDWTLYLIEEVIRIDERYSSDSLKLLEKNRYFAVGLRADRETGTLHYRNRDGELLPVKPDDNLQRYMFKKDGTLVWLPCYYEEY